MVRFWFLKAIGGPGSLRLLWSATALSLILMIFRRTRRIGRRILIGFLASYLVMSLPAVARTIAGPNVVAQARPLAEYGQFEDIFVIDGDNMRARAALAVELSRTAKPRFVWVVGGGELRDAMLEFGLEKRLWRWGGGAARTTYDQMVWVKESVVRDRIPRPAIVASRMQIARIEGVARHLDLDAVLIPSPLDDEPPVAGASAWLPHLSGLFLSRDGLYERVAMAYYRWKGWM